MVVAGTRPEAVKVAPLVLELQQREWCQPILVVTGQHREMLRQALRFSVSARMRTSMQSERQTLADVTAKALLGLMPVMANLRPDVVVVQGDTTSTFAGALAGFYSGVRVVHLEAGLRTGNVFEPFPGVPELEELDASSRPVILVTAHRRESWGDGMDRIGRALATLAVRHPSTTIVFPVHKNPVVRESILKHLVGHPNVIITEPLNYASFCRLMSRSTIVLTDSGGAQEEAPELGKSVLVMRDRTERPEAVETRVVQLVGTNERRIVESVETLLARSDLFALPQSQSLRRWIRCPALRRCHRGNDRGRSHAVRVRLLTEEPAGSPMLGDHSQRERRQSLRTRCSMPTDGGHARPTAHEREPRPQGHRSKPVRRS